MPSPIGHALAGFAAGWVIAPGECRSAASTTCAEPAARPGTIVQRVTGWTRRWPWAVGFAGVAILPDLDLLVGQHSRYTHSVGAALLVSALAFVLVGRTRNTVFRIRAATAFGAAYASHLLLDWMGADTTPPFGIMALWPFSQAFYISPVAVFGGISRRYWLWAAWVQDAESLARELVVLVPVAVLAAWARRPQRGNCQAPDGPGRAGESL